MSAKQASPSTSPNLQSDPPGQDKQASSTKNDTGVQHQPYKHTEQPTSYANISSTGPGANKSTRGRKPTPYSRVWECDCPFREAWGANE